MNLHLHESSLLLVLPLIYLVVSSYVAAKSYYFSVGGGCRQFEELVNRDSFFRLTVEKVIKGTSTLLNYHARASLL